MKVNDIIVNEVDEAKQEMYYNVFIKYNGIAGMEMCRKMIAVQGIESTFLRILQEAINQDGIPNQEIIDMIYNSLLWLNKLHSQNN